MGATAWSEHLRVHIKSVDDEHKGILAALAKLDQAVEKGEISAVSPLFEEIFRLAQEHFRNEEALLAKHRYLGIDKQQREHNSFLDRLKQLRLQIARSPLPAGKQVLEYAHSWLLAHITGADAAYCEYLREHGVT